MSGHHNISLFNHVFTYVMYGYKMTITYVPQKRNKFNNFSDVEEIIYQEIVRNPNLSKEVFWLCIYFGISQDLMISFKVTIKYSVVKIQKKMFSHFLQNYFGISRSRYISLNFILISSSRE